MKWKVTGRYLLSVVLVVILVIFINFFVMLGLFIAQKGFDVPIFQDQAASPEQFTREFEQRLDLAGDSIAITAEGKDELQKKNAWLQVLDENGNEVLTYRVPAGLKKHYTPADMIQMYKYQEVDGDTTVFVGEKASAAKRYSYLIGIENRDLNRYVIFYDNQVILRAFNVGLIIFMIDILIALWIGYWFSKRLTQPMHSLIDGIKQLANNQFYVHYKPEGVYQHVFDNLNQLSHQLQANEKERKKLDRLKEEWIANISHDMKTPLASIQGYSEMIKDPDYQFTWDEIREYAGIIEKKSVYIKEVIEDLNLTTRLRNKELSIQKKTVNIVTLLRGIVIDILNDPKYAKRHIEFTVTEEFIPVEVDEILMVRAINNLIYNAIVHNHDEVKIEVSVEKQERVHISIKDDGKGIKKAELERIFDRYYRGTNTGDAHKGSGLGMAIARDIIDAHQGEIVISSEEGQGTSIEIVL
ncbi:sensor histidine kinase [Brevibacillus parabrevis]|jgi:signal transduction histidine kinase|uniref:histidine kinase n=1 Tax=Brevibacillus parabrevis TaxID=54914 RepID=A0A4Y3PRC8_BREPA|nr:HAMP domain-containing sensor histidine kinase [Brevibacillus parabrevis]RNB97452.1 sensor histidine kinase [Brevibacillus parabrevis]GEB34506.1 two-component sensor histidine kinase [Brevibacillus parabrevis]